VNAVLKVWLSELYNSANSDPQLALLASIKEIGWQMRNIEGRERSNVASSIAGAALTRDTLVANAPSTGLGPTCCGNSREASGLLPPSLFELRRM
jgi:hypothetical protein